MSIRVRKPEWLKVSFRSNDNFARTKQIVEGHGLHTICTSGRCPNIGECWGRGTATFMIGGEICTRSCKFCNTLTGKPLPLDVHEPERLAESIKLMNLNHAVITSVDRDDLQDLGADHWVKTIRAIQEVNPQTTLEVLIPDFQGKLDLVDLIIDSAPDVISHNIETVRRLTPEVRSAAKYDTSLQVLAHIATKGAVAKSGLMLGLGEREDEVIETMADLYRTGCSVLTIGQYLQPSRKNLPVSEYITPEKFAEYKQKGIEMGFKEVESAPLIRSSYFAERHVKPRQ